MEKESKLIYGNKYIYLLTYNHAAGKKNRYTVYRIPQRAPTSLSHYEKHKIIGRELSLRFIKQYLSFIIKHGELKSAYDLWKNKRTTDQKIECQKYLEKNVFTKNCGCSNTDCKGNCFGYDL